ncbi:MAG: energy-coupling factor transporter ATPase [Eubacteriales bacterium]|nr:energy-coupling factor transporter ATPase [Eubacteriales bacterium]
MIEVKKLTHVYSEGLPHQQVAVEDISFTIETGEFVGIIGHTGSGKSTLLQHLNGLLKPKSGSIVIDGLDITNSKTAMIDVRKKVGLVFQYPEYQLFEETVAKDVAFGPQNLGLPQEEIDERVRSSIMAVGLNYDSIKNISPFELSGGQKRRVAIAGVIAMNPDILILDEPTAGLNPKAHEDILNLIRGIYKKGGKTVILVSHNMNDIARICDSVLVMDKGRLAMKGTPKQVFSRGEELKDMGLALPEATEITSRLRAAGMEINKICLTIEEAAAAIAEAKKMTT